MSKRLSDLSVGALVRDPNTTYLGEPIVWKIAEQARIGYPEGSTTLITQKIITTKCFDAKEDGNSNRDRQLFGNNRWSISNLRQWINSAERTWYSPQHDADAPPINSNCFNGKGGYQSQDGFLTGFSADFLNNILETTYEVTKPSIDGEGDDTVTDKFFLPNLDEVNLASGTSFPIFTNDESRKAYFSTVYLPIFNNLYNKNETLSSPQYWWLRDPYSQNSGGVRCLYPASYGYYSAFYDSIGVRPVCNLNSSIYLLDEPDENGVFEITFSIDTAPHISGGDIDQGDVYGGFNYEYRVIDGSETDTITVVEAIDGEQIRSYTVTLGATNTVALTREKWLSLSYGKHAVTITATDTENQTDTRTVAFNKNQAAPTITGSDGSLGEVSEKLTYKYTVDDKNSVDGDVVTVVEKLDGIQKRSYTAQLGTETEFAITAVAWKSLAYGNHTIVITATDKYGLTATRQQAFVKRNFAPSISGSDQDLGTKTTDFDYSYTVYDDNFIDGDTVTVVEKLNGVKIKDYTLTEQVTKSVSVSGEAFLRLVNAASTISITATDTQGETITRTVTFTKRQNISVTLAAAIPNDGDQTAKPVEATVLTDAYIPAGALFSAQICNNGFDAEPVWEDCTIEARNGKKYEFANAEKTADRWGVNIRINIIKNTATETPYIRSVLLKFKY